MALSRVKLLELRAFYDGQLGNFIDELSTIEIVPENMEHIRSILNEIEICMNQNDKVTKTLDRMPEE